MVLSGTSEVVRVVDLGGVLGNDDVDDETDTDTEDLGIDDDEEAAAAAAVVVMPLALATRARDVPLPPAGLLCRSFSFCSLYSRSFRSAGVSTL